MRMTNNITCDACKYSVDVNASGKVKLCDAPYEHKMYRKKAQKHGNSFSCGYGEPYGVTLAEHSGPLLKRAKHGGEK